MISVTKLGVVLTKTSNEFENEGVLNPAVILHKGVIHMFYRAVRQGNHSTIGHCTFETPISLSSRDNVPVLMPVMEYESHGIEDPRIVKIEDLFYLTYTVFDGVNALGALAISNDLVNWKRLGLITPRMTYNEFFVMADLGNMNAKYLRYNKPKKNFERFSNNKMFVWDKNLIFFPRKVNGKLYFLHRIKPDIQIVQGINNLDELNPAFWENYLSEFNKNIVIAPRHDHEISYVGGGCPPIETEAGWLVIYHGVHDAVSGYVYSACAALLDLENPQKEISRLPYPLFFPEFSWELKGEVNNVCFPTGAVVMDDILYIYYGAADERIACASVNIHLLINELILYSHDVNN